MANFLKSLFVKGVEIDTASATAGKVLTYDGTKFAPATPGSGSLALDDLTDVVITSPATTQFVRYNGTDWVNATISAGDVPTLNQNTTGTAATVTGAAQTNITSVGTLTGLTSSGQINVSRGALGTVSGNELTFLNPSATTTNGERLDTRLIRSSNGVDWTTAVWRMGRLVDATRMGFVQFGSFNVEFGTGTTVYGTVNTSGFSGAGSGLTSLNASNLSSGTVASARISGSYTGITGLGTLGSLTIDGPSSSSFTLGDSAFAGYSGVVGDKGYLLVSNSVGDPVTYLRSSGAGSVNLGASNSNTLQVGNGTATVVGTMNATTFSGSGSSLTSLPSSQLTGQTGMWTSVNRPGPYRLYRRDNDSNFSVQTYWTGARWRLYGYNGDSVHADTHVGYADSAGTAATVTTAAQPAITSVGTLSSLMVNAEMYVTGGAAGYAFRDRGGTGEYFVWYSSGADAYLYSSRLTANVMGFARTTGITYIYKGLNMQNTSIDFVDSISPNTNNAGFVGFPFGLYKAWAWVAAYNFHTASDIRYKQNIETLPLGINFLRLIDPIKFTYLYPQFEEGNDTPISVDAGTRPRAGLSAQNVRQALDTLGAGDYNFWSLTNKDNAESMQILDYTGFIAPVIQAIKELDARLQQLETE